MKVVEIHYGDVFEEQFLLLPKVIQQKACKAERLFRQNPFHPSLRLHKLSGKLDGLWSISLDMRHRIVFSVVGEGVILFVSIGGHAIYEG